MLPRLQVAVFFNICIFLYGRNIKNGLHMELPISNFFLKRDEKKAGEINVAAPTV
jgi:hypothetical protein